MERRLEIGLITGGVAEDYRGQIRFVNDFDMTQVKRFYIIKNVDTKIVRGWRAHRVEQRWFYVLSGAFTIDIVKIDDWKDASVDLPIEQVVLSANEQRILCVPAGHGTAFRSLEQESELLVFADSDVSKAKNDDHTWPSGYFVNRK